MPRMTKTARKRLAREKRAQAERAAPLDQRELSSMLGWRGGEKHNSKASVKAAKKTARHMSSEARYQSGSRITMASSAQMQWASDHTKQLAPRDGAIFKMSTGKTWLRRGTK